MVFLYYMIFPKDRIIKSKSVKWRHVLDMPTSFMSWLGSSIFQALDLNSHRCHTNTKYIVVAKSGQSGNNSMDFPEKQPAMIHLYLLTWICSIWNLYCPHRNLYKSHFIHIQTYGNANCPIAYLGKSFFCKR